MAKPVQISSPAQLDSLLKSSAVVVVDFYADWCGPCRAIAPVYESLSTSLSRPNIITFAKVNTDTQREIAAKYAISALPTFMVFKQGQPGEKIQGADKQKLDRVVRDLAAMATGAGNSGTGNSGTGNSGGDWHKVELPKGYSDVTDQVSLKGLDILNVDSEFGGVEVLFEKSKPSALDSKGKSAEEGNVKDWVVSDTDEQLMLYLPFHSSLKIHTLQITSLPDANEDAEPPMRPKTICLYTNRPHILGFEEAEDIPANQTVAVTAEDWDANGMANIPLRFVKFQNVTSLVLFVMDGDGDGERVRLDRIRIIGETGEKRDPGKLEKISDHD